jgi:hypothetical protein
MNSGTRDHDAEIKNWMSRACAGLTFEQQILFLEKTLRVLLKRIEPTLGPVVLTSLLERILYDGAQRFPFLSGLPIDFSNGVDFAAFKKDMAHVQREEFAAAFTSLFAALFMLIDRLTGESLTPAMYAQLPDKPTSESL